MKNVWRTLVGVAIWGLVATAPLPAQGALSLSGGVSDFDLAGTGTATVVALRLESTKYKYLIGGIGVAWFSYWSPPPPPRAHIIHLLPELSVQLQYPLGWFRPFAGVGVGWSSMVQNGNREDLTLHVVGGARIAMGIWALRTELRVRAIDPFHGTTGDVTVGVGRVLE